jgi:hypothetical protein
MRAQSLILAVAVLIAPLAGFSADHDQKTDAISKIEATKRAQQFLDNEIQIEGALGQVSIKGSTWAFPVKLGYAGTVQRNPILVDRLTGAVSWAGLSEHKAMLARARK